MVLTVEKVKMQIPVIRNASSVIIIRKDNVLPSVLMGQRGKSAVFMPNKFVFPGGAVDQSDFEVSLISKPDDICLRRLKEYSNISNTQAFLSAAIREVWEETGLMFGSPANDKQSVSSKLQWKSFSELGLAPSAQDFRFIFRAITPPQRTRRFDARFFLVDAKRIIGDLDDFSKASDELSHLKWFTFSEARKLDLPFITEIVLAEAEAQMENIGCPLSVPFFNNTTEKSEFIRIY